MLRFVEGPYLPQRFQERGLQYGAVSGPGAHVPVDGVGANWPRAKRVLHLPQATGTPSLPRLRPHQRQRDQRRHAGRGLRLCNTQVYHLSYLSARINSRRPCLTFNKNLLKFIS